MGARSDVGLALTEKAVQRLKKDYANVWAWLIAKCESHGAREDAQLFLFECVKWNYEDKDVAYLYEALDGTEEEFKLVEVCLDFPTSDENDAGCWEGNPWGLCRVVSAALHIK